MAQRKKKAPAKAKKQANEDEGVRIRPNLEKYVSGKAASGAATKNSGDFVAKLIEGFTYSEVYALVAAVRDDVTATDLEQRYIDLKNDGLRRMNAGNLLRKVANADGGEDRLTKAAAATRKKVDARMAKAAKAKESKKAA